VTILHNLVCYCCRVAYLGMFELTATITSDPRHPLQWPPLSPTGTLLRVFTVAAEQETAAPSLRLLRDPDSVREEFRRASALFHGVPDTTNPPPAIPATAGAAGGPQAAATASEPTSFPAPPLALLPVATVDHADAGGHNENLTGRVLYRWPHAVARPCPAMRRSDPPQLMMALPSSWPGGGGRGVCGRFVLACLLT
jgi:hypothetical protein